jgi:hypothetical protein
MRGFAGEGQLPMFAVKLRAVFDQLGDVARPFFDQYIHCFFVTQPRASNEGVLNVHFHCIIVAQDNRDAALGIFRIRFGELVFRQDGNAPRLC